MKDKTLMWAILGIVLVIVVVGGIVLATSGNKSSDNLVTEEDPVKIEDEVRERSSVTEEDVIAEEDSTTESEGVTEGEDSIGGAGSYEAYDESKLAMAENGDVVLFFHASWCPTCRALDGDIEENIAEIPADLAILKVDYDSANELKSTYGVTTQHTMVQVDAEGNQITKWVGSNTLEELVSEVQ